MNVEFTGHRRKHVEGIKTTQKPVMSLAA